MRCVGKPEQVKPGPSLSKLLRALLSSLLFCCVPSRFVVFALLVPLSACDLLASHPSVVIPDAPTPGPEGRCTDACVAKAHACTAAQCARGCQLVLDKLVEREGARILSCVARAAPGKPSTCNEMTFADCAARTGPNADGGPLPPRPPSIEDDDL
jgi:hypothetical protein